MKYKLLTVVVGFAIGGHALAQDAGGALSVGGSVIVTPGLPDVTKKLPAKVGSGMPGEDFAALINSETPLSPEQARRVLQLADQIQRASAERPYPAPVPAMNRVRVSFEAGKAPMIIRLDQNATSAVVMTDSTGAPWPIKMVRAGRKGLLDIPEDGKDLAEDVNTFTVTPLKPTVATNIQIFLKGAPAPITMDVATGQPEVDYRLEVAVDGRGPKAEVTRSPVTTPSTTANLAPAEMDQMLGGVMPSGARLLKAESSGGVDATAYEFGKHMYLKSRSLLISPRPLLSVAAADGTRVYKVPCAGTVLWLDNGKDGISNISGCKVSAFEPQKAN